MKLTSKLILGAAILSSSSSFGAFSFTVAFGALYDNVGADIGVGKVGVLVVSADATFPQGAALEGKGFTQYNQWGTNDYVIATFSSVSANVTGDPKSPQSQFSTTTPTIDYASLPGISAGSKVALYWFPSITSPATIITGGATGLSYGFHRSDSTANIGITGITALTNNGFVTPADLTAGFRLIARNVDALTATQETQMGANYKPSVLDYTAAAMVPATVPEPSTYALVFGLITIGLYIRRRK